jgi:hypothetical protein
METSKNSDRLIISILKQVEAGTPSMTKQQKVD